ncbi:MAG TPA: L-histidine N(alpha)-methyltransferase [Cytophagaceae bacterium]|jgi:L-histidine N-alpha-methyltransferase|nr:L-histidine N(alpha)-methyltransferase [Cytophagaceae bacterium]
MLKLLRDRDIRKENLFAKDVLAGLSKHPKHLSSKYFYNDRGDELFQEIMHLPEYYPTKCEYEILNANKAEFLKVFPHDNFFQLIDLGAGDGLKTTLLLEYFLEQHVDFEFTPIDISQNAIDKLVEKIHIKLPQLRTSGIATDYFEALNRLKERKNVKKVVLFLGSNIGNFQRKEAVGFLYKLHKSLNKGDLLLIGFDLKKDPRTIMCAYDDNKGITAAFNYNLLIRMNDELDANFILSQFSHAPSYCPETGELKSFIISKCKQTVKIGRLHKTFHFEPWEAILTEYSNKYDLGGIESMAKESGFEMIKNYFDKKCFFTDSLWRVK